MKPIDLFYKYDFNRRSFVFLNQVLTKKDLEELLSWMFRNYGLRKTCVLTDLLKEAGFNYATQGGLSISLEDLKVPSSKTILVGSTNKNLEKTETEYLRGKLTSSELFQKQVMSWNLTSEMLKNEIVEFFERTDPLNPLYMMTFSGARGNLSQVRQLIGMRGLMSDQKGEMIGSAIQKNFREGLSVIDFLISSYGARKGLVDTAIRTADSGYMTRRLIDIAQDIIIRQFDCQAKYGVLFIRNKPYTKKQTKIDFESRLLGRILAKPIIHPLKKTILAHRGQEVDFNLLNEIKQNNIQIVSIISPLTCQAYRSVCQACFGWDLVQHRLIEIGESIGIIAAQSIGEPGTQLTMRTFHTGGVFSRELNQQIRSDYSGQVKFAETLKTSFIRTSQGEYAQVIRNTSFFDITTYKNEILRIKVDRDDLLLIKDGEFIKKGQPIVQAAAQFEESDTEVQKTLTTKFSGEIYYQPRQNYNFFEYNMIIWLLAGNLIVLPLESKKYIRCLNKDKKIVAKTKQAIKSNPFTETIRVIDDNHIGLILQFLELKNLQILKSQSTKAYSKSVKYLAKTNSNKHLLLKKDLIAKSFYQPQLYLGRLVTNNYKVKTGGILYSIHQNKILSLQVRIKSFQNSSSPMTDGNWLVWLPEQTYFYSNEYQINLSNGSLIKQGNWMFSNVFSPITALIKTKKSTKRYNELIVQPGTVYKFEKSKVINDKWMKIFNGQFFFPGEILLGKIRIKRPVYTEIIVTKRYIKLILRPILLFNRPKQRIYLPVGQTVSNLSQDLILTEKNFLGLKPGDAINSTSKKPNNLLEIGLYIVQPNQPLKNTSSIFNLLKNENTNIWSLEIGRSYPLTNQTNLFPRRLKFQKIDTTNFVRSGQIVEPYSILSIKVVKSQIKNEILNARSQYSKRYQSQELLLITKDQTRELYFDEINIPSKTNDFVFSGDLIGSNIILHTGGKIYSQKGSKINYRVGQPYLFTEGAKVYKNHQDFAPENTVLGFVTYRVFKTQDIIQGLPKVEEILEARGSSDKALISEKSGVITKIVSHSRGRNNQIEMLSNIKQFRTIREVPYVLEDIDKESIEAELYDYINVGERIHKGLIDPQNLLDIYFNYFKQINSHEKAALRSLYKIASIFIKSIQAVYENQGIRILDRHLEVIVRRMLVRGQIEYPGSTSLVAGEYLDIQQLLILNSMLNQKRKKLVYYKPAILGLTKAALTTESFISAASFQESIKILTQAAIEGKVDWLRGLKEKVILGGLIPCGTGILTFLDEWVAKNVFLFARNVTSIKTRRKLLRKKLAKENSNISDLLRKKDTKISVNNSIQLSKISNLNSTPLENFKKNKSKK